MFILGGLKVETNVSVLLTIRNAEKYIGSCLTSLLNQTFSNFDIVIVDDESNDKTIFSDTF